MKRFWMVGVLFGLLATAALAGGTLPNHHKKTCVPEPVSMFALGTGALMLIAKRKKA